MLNKISLLTKTNTNKIVKIEKSNIKFSDLQLKVSSALEHLEIRLKKKYNMHNYLERNKPTLFFGIYNKEDLIYIKNHRSSVYIMWGGSDIDIRLSSTRLIVEFIKKIKIEKHYAISQDIFNRLKSLGFNSEIFDLNLVDKDLFKPVSTKGKKIYIYNGLYENDVASIIYNNDAYTVVMKILPEYEFILSS
jgi:hypothetical protein